MKRLLWSVLCAWLLVSLTACQYVTSYRTDQLLPEREEAVTHRRLLLGLTITEEATGRTVELTDDEADRIFLLLEGIECSREPLREEAALYRISFHLAEGTADDFCLYSPDRYSVGRYTYTSLTGSVDLLSFERLFSEKT